MDEKTAFEEFKSDIKTKMAEMRKEVKQKASDFFQQATKHLFEKYPDMEEFSWTQYTVYFNDGDTCYFSAHTDWGLEVNGRGEDDDYDEEEGSVYAIKRDIERYNPVDDAVIVAELKKKLVKAEAYEGSVNAKRKEISEVLGSFDDDDFLAMFGDHTRVTVTREGVTTDEYTDHD